MRDHRRTLCVVATALFVFTTAGVGALSASSGSAQRESFEELLERAAEAHRRGDLGGARGWLLKADRRVRRRLAGNWVWWFWVGLGLLGQVFFTARFLVQWVASERRGASVVPVAFWYFSLLGSTLLLSYSIWRLDPVFILGQSFNSFIYIRNLTFIYRARRREAKAGAADSQEASG